MSDIYADALDELKDRLEYSIASGKLNGVVDTVYVGPQPEKRIGNTGNAVIFLLDGGFVEDAISAGNQEMHSEYTIIVRILSFINQNIKESSNTMYSKDGQELPVRLPVDLAGTGLIYLRSKVLDSIYTDTNGNRNCLINSGVRYIKSSGSAPIFQDDKYYQDINLSISTGVFGVNGRNS